MLSKVEALKFKINQSLNNLITKLMRGKSWIRKISSIFYLFGIYLVFFATKVFAQCTNQSTRIDCENAGCLWTEGGCVSGSRNALGEYIQNIYTHYAIPIGLAIGVGMLVYAGIKYTTSSGNPEQIAEAKDIAVSTIIGLVVLLLAGLILSLINPNANYSNP